MTDTQHTTPDSSRAGWLLYHSVGMFPGQEAAMRTALEEFTNVWCKTDLARWDYGLATRQEALRLFAQLIHAPEEALFASENVTQAFAKFVGGLGRKRLANRRVLIAADCFPSLHYLLSGLASTLGFTLDTVPVDAQTGYVTDDDFIARWQDDVALAVVVEVRQRVGAERFDDTDAHAQAGVGGIAIRKYLPLLGTDAQDRLRVLARVQPRQMVGGQLQQFAVRQPQAIGSDVDGKKIHGGRADESGDELVGRMAIDSIGGVELLHTARAQHHHAVGHGHGFDLIVGDENHGGFKLLRERLDFGAHLGTQLGVQVRERLVKQKHLGVTHHGSAHRDTLALPARERTGFAL